MPHYSVHFEWQDIPNDIDAARYALSAETIAEAKVEAALIYACEPFRGAAPSAFVILENGANEVYRFPEDGSV